MEDEKDQLIKRVDRLKRKVYIIESLNALQFCVTLVKFDPFIVRKLQTAFHHMFLSCPLFHPFCFHHGTAYDLKLHSLCPSHLSLSFLIVKTTTILLPLVRVSQYRKKLSPTHTYPDHQHPLLAPPPTTIHSILPVQFTCLTVFLYNLFPNPFWFTSWFGTLHFILHTFFHPIIVFSQHMPIPSQLVLLHYRYYVIYS